MPAWPDPRSLSVGFALDSNAYDDPTTLTYTIISPGDDPDTGVDPGPVLDELRVERGRIGDAPTTQPTRMDFRLRDDDATFNRRNISSPYHGRIRLGMWVRAFVDVGSGPRPFATGSVVQWNSTSRGPGMDRRVEVIALGILSRIGRDRTVWSPLSSTIRAVDEVQGYWSLEGNDTGSRLPDRPALTSNDLNGLSTDSDLPGSLPLPVFAAGTSLAAVVSGDFSTGAWSVSMVTRFPAAPSSAVTLLEIDVEGGDVAHWLVDVDASEVTLTGYDDDGSIVHQVSDSTSLHATLTAGEWVGLYVFSSETFSDFGVTVADLGGSGVGVADTGLTLAGRPTAVRIPASEHLAGVAFGHLAVMNEVTPGWLLPAVGLPVPLNGYTGETAADRIERLCAEEGLPVVVAAGDTERMGPQLNGTTMTNLRDCESTDHGVLGEARDGRLAYQPRSARYNLTPTVLRYGDEDGTDSDVSDLVSIDDDRDTYNLVTVKSSSTGATATAELVDGPVGSDTSTGIGPRPLSVQRNVYNPARLVDHANWTRAIKTVDKQRQTVALNLYTNPDLAAAWLSSDIGSRLLVTDPPPEDFGPDDLDLILEGSKDVIGAARWDVTAFGEPYAPYDVGTYQDTDASGDVPRYDGERSSTSGDFLTGTDSSLTVATSGGPLWTTNPPGGFPILVKVHGVTLTVSNITGSSSPQTFTISAANVDGVTIPSGSQIRVARPPRYGL